MLWPDRSIIRQSYDARERLLDPSLPAHLGHGNLNADGFGIGWYSDSLCEALLRGTSASTPCTFKAITPAWNNDNLMRLASKIYSSLMFAHVRAAYPGMPVSEQHCHPFAHNHYMFIHNGIIAGFAKIRRKLVGGLSDAAYDAVHSFHSDSAVSFALFLSFLPNMDEHQGADVMLHALQSTLQYIHDVQREAGIETDTSLLNFVVTDGRTLIATRFVSSSSDNPASLYYAEGTTFGRSDGTSAHGEAPYTLEYADKGVRVVILASEPITGAASEWVAVPRNHALIVTRDADGWMNVLHTPVHATAPGPRMDEVITCLKAIPLGVNPWEDKTAGAPGMLQRLVRGMQGSEAGLSTTQANQCCPMCGGSQYVNLHSQVMNLLRSNNGGALCSAGTDKHGPPRRASALLRSHGWT